MKSEVEINSQVLGYEEIDAMLEAFEAGERKRLNIEEEKVEQWSDPNPQTFTRDQRDSTTILFGGLTLAHDEIVSAALDGLGYKVQALEVPTNDALRYGKEFGNRGQCNPTYLTVGNLVKHLVHLRDVEKMSTKDIVEKHMFITAGACGPCRFGTYVTEYRKALRDAGFDGFRVMLFQQQGGLRQATGDNPGLEFVPKFFITLLQSVMAGDVINLIGYRIRPYEIEKGSTDRALEECKAIVRKAFSARSSVIAALLKCRRIMAKVKVNRLQAKPKVAIIGEFWAMTTEGDGNYRLQRFLEEEGAEVDIQPITAWLLYNIWVHVWDTKQRMLLRSDDGGKFGLEGKNPRKKIAILKVAEQALRGTFALYCKTIGLGGYHLSDMDEIATISHQYYDNHLRGGEGHMEVGKLIQHVEQRKSHMVISVKPFGCMPSSGVSDGVQSLVTAKHPEAVFCAIETTGDGAVNVQSRVQMDLFKARQKAVKEYQELLTAAGITQEEAVKRSSRHGYDKSLFYPKHTVAGTAANTIVHLKPAVKSTIKSHKAKPMPAPVRGVNPVGVSREIPPEITATKVGFNAGRINLVPVSRSAGSAAAPPR